MPTRRRPPPSITIPFETWQYPPLADEDCRLTAHVLINGVPFLAEALPVCWTDDGRQEDTCESSRSRLSGLAAEFDAPGFQTIRIGESDYIVILVPHSD